MPKKPSSWGQQEYVPAGNGDASGEYADGSGNNTHFASFKQPEPQVEEKVNEENIEVELSEEKPKDFKDSETYFNANTFPPKNAQIIKEAFDRGDKESQDFVLNELNKNGIQYKIDPSVDVANYNPKDGNIYSKAVQMSNKNDIIHASGQTYYHETGHAIDFAYGIEIPPKSKNIEKGSPLYKLLTSHEPASAVVEVKDGKTICDLIEQDSLKGGNELYHEMDNAYMHEQKALEEKYDIQRTTTQIKEKLNGANDIINLFCSSDRERKKLLKQWVSNGTYDKDFINEIENYFETKKKIDTTINQKWSDISDIAQASYGEPINNVGHAKNYFNKRSNKSTEFFAEYLSAKATNPASFELIKKYFPQASEGCELLIKMIKDGKLNGRR